MSKACDYDFSVGIDPGTYTGLAIREIASDKVVLIKTCTITKAFRVLRTFLENDNKLFLFIENPHLRKWYGHNARLKQQGAGSVKRDYKIWAQWCEEENVDFAGVHPKNIPHYNSKTIKSMTGWPGRTSEHARIAAVLCMRKPDLC